MSLPMNSDCILCHIRRYVGLAQGLGDEKTATAYARRLMQIYLDATEDSCIPLISAQATDLLVEFYGVDRDRFREEKALSNRFALARLDQIRRQAENAPDPLYAGLQLAILGNYIDFGALHGEVSFDVLDGLLQEAEKMELDRDVYTDLCRDLEKGRKLLYLTDNAGEIVFDRVFAEQMQKQFPHLEITFCVRGGPASNDATREDAILAGIPFPVIDNGTLIAGTVPGLLSEEAREALFSADVIIAKGQGNCESLYGTELNIYYAFLVKCNRFIQQFQKPKLTPMLTK